MFEREYRELAVVPRWGVIRKIQSQSVAEHCYYVTLYALQTARLIQWTHSGMEAELMHYALVHDLSEAFTGDIAGPAKRHLVDRKAERKLEDWLLQDRFGSFLQTIQGNGIREIVKFADLLDQVMFIQTEIQMGNGTLGRGMENLLGNIHQGAPSVCSVINQTLGDAWGNLHHYSDWHKEDFEGVWRDQMIPAINEHRVGLSRVLDNPPKDAKP